MRASSRRLAFLVVFTGLIFFAARSQTPAVRELAPGVYFWQGDHDRKMPANCTWIVFKDYVLVIDANFPVAAKEIIPLIHSTTGKPIRFLFDTHWHGDHTTANSMYRETGATVLCSSACAEELRTKGAQARVPPEPPTMSFDDRMVFDDGTHRVELTLKGPAHSRGDAVAYLPKEQILVSGDLCVNWNWGNNVADPDADFDRWLRVLDELSQWKIQTVVPGHGSLASIDTMRRQRDYLADMQDKVRRGIESRKTPDQLVHEIDLSRHGSFAVSAPDNEVAIRAMYRKLSVPRR
jgi:cyclase